MRGLTQRQRQVAELILRGFSTKEIGRLLGTSPSNVVTHQKRAAAKLGLQGTAAKAYLSAHIARDQALLEVLLFLGPVKDGTMLDVALLRDEITRMRHPALRDIPWEKTMRGH